VQQRIEVKHADYACCSGLYYLTDTKVPWDAERPTYKNEAGDRWVYWNAKGYGWTVGKNFEENFFYGGETADGPEPWMGEWANGVQVNYAVDIADQMPVMSDRIVTTSWDDSNADFDLVRQVGEFTPTVVKSEDLDLVFDKVCAEAKDDMFGYFFQAYPVKQTIGDWAGTMFSKPKPGTIDEPFAPRLLECVHGYFELCESYPTRICMRSSWDETSVVGSQVSLYGISHTDGQPYSVQHLVLPELPQACHN
jgi:hypothetical protein